MHECPDCGQACDCDGEDVWTDYNRNCAHICKEDDDDFYDDDFFDDDYNLDACVDYNLDACVDCGSPNAFDQCQCCGGWLCHMHSEVGGGFCRCCPTLEWIVEGR